MILLHSLEVINSAADVLTLLACDHGDEHVLRWPHMHGAIEHAVSCHMVDLDICNASPYSSKLHTSFCAACQGPFELHLPGHWPLHAGTVRLWAKPCAHQARCATTMTATAHFSNGSDHEEVLTDFKLASEGHIQPGGSSVALLLQLRHMRAASMCKHGRHHVTTTAGEAACAAELQLRV
jgi:hypothetical protein